MLTNKFSRYTRILNLLAFSPGERRGIFVVVAVLSTIIFLRFFSVNRQTTDAKPLDQITRKWEKKQRYSKRKSFDTFPKNKRRITPFIFDPNTLPTDSFVLMGLSPKQAAVIEKYRANGGYFGSASDFSKLFIVSPHFYLAVREFIRISPSQYPSATKPSPNHHTHKPHIMFEINSATAEELATLPFIGEKRAAALIDYREKVTGIRHISQIINARCGFTRKTIDSLSSYFVIDTAGLPLFDINSASLLELKAHPEIGFFRAKKICEYRKLVGHINSVDELATNKILDSIAFNRAKWYLRVYKQE